jgi:hypothetical protein
MKLSAAILSLSAASVAAFCPVQQRQQSMMRQSSSFLAVGGMDTSGNTWKPDSEKMGVSVDNLFL